MKTLTIMMVTRGGDTIGFRGLRSLPFPRVLGWDKVEPIPEPMMDTHLSVNCRRSIVEDVHDEMLMHVKTTHVLRLDDDETVSPAMAKWLRDGEWQAHDHWKFPRMNMWSAKSGIVALGTLQLFPDHQTRLSRVDLAGGRNHIHAGSPNGGGEEAPVCIYHWKFVEKTYEQRRAIAESYDRVQPGAGTGGMLAFSLPEDAYRGQEVPTFWPGLGEHLPARGPDIKLS